MYKTMHVRYFTTLYSEQDEYLAVSQSSVAVSTGDQSASITLPVYSASSLSDGKCVERSGGRIEEIEGDEVKECVWWSVC